MDTREMLEFEIAKRRVSDYSQEIFAECERDPLMKLHEEAIERFDCQDRLQAGINAFHWLARCESSIREGVDLGLIDNSPEYDETIAALYRAWLIPCDSAEAMVETQLKREHTVDNLSEFRECCEAVRDWLDRHDWKARAARTRASRFASEPW